MAKQQTSPNNNRGEMVYCERCGEDYSATYRRCPFCDERPGRRIDDYGYTARSPLRLVVLIGSLVLILAAAFIVFSKVAPLLGSKNPDPGVEAPGVEEPMTPEETPVIPEVVKPANPDAVPANAVVLSRTDMTLAPGEKFSILATVSPADTTDTLVWSCDKPDILTVNQDGSVVNNNATGEKVTVTVTATAGGVTAECIVRCNSGPKAVTPDTPSTDTPAVGVNAQGKVSGAGNGLNVRSGPGSNYSKVASITNGTKVTVLEDSGNGWYKIDYGSGKIGYVSSKYITVTASGSGSTSSSSSSSSSSSGSSSSSSGSSSSGSGSSGASISGKTPAKVTGAANGLNVRSGPGSNYEKVASIANGNSVVILENTGTGWYKIDYGNGKVGYASVNYIKPK